MFRPLAVMVCAAMLIASPIAASAVVGDDYAQDKPDLFCPAVVARVVPLDPENIALSDSRPLGPDSDFSIVLSADLPKDFRGTLRVLSNENVYHVAVRAAIVSKVTITYPAAYARRTTTLFYESNPFRVRFPSKVPIEAIWVETVRVDGGLSDCPIQPLTYFPKPAGTRKLTEKNPAKRDPIWPSDADVRTMSAGPPFLATRTGTFDRHKCSETWVDAKSIYLESPVWPWEEPRFWRHRTVIVKVVLDEAGNVADESILFSGGDIGFDRSALDAASKSSFKPKQFLCTPIPGTYSMKFNYDPSQ
ncbi:MAG: energy transducer TonB [Candidatus Eremiobacteraeota bacterium]|nr:energy transducer TonB [Candidatus Eremiobacteraeota bacterium]